MAGKDNPVHVAIKRVTDTNEDDRKNALIKFFSEIYTRDDFIVDSMDLDDVVYFNGYGGI